MTDGHKYKFAGIELPFAEYDEIGRRVPRCKCGHNKRDHTFSILLVRLDPHEWKTDDSCSAAGCACQRYAPDA
jgi:hypothetical protein